MGLQQDSRPPESPRVIPLAAHRLRRRSTRLAPSRLREPRQAHVGAGDAAVSLPARPGAPFCAPPRPGAGPHPALPRRLTRRWRRVIALDLPAPMRLALPLDRLRTADWIDLPASALALCHDDDLDRETLVLSPLYAPRVDPLEIARQLQLRGFAGLYVALGAVLPDPHLVAGELARQAPVVDFLPLGLDSLTA